MSALARIMEYTTADVADKTLTEVEEDRPKVSRQLKAMSSREKEVAFAARIRRRLHIWVWKRGL